MGGGILPVPGEEIATLNLLKRFPNVAVYGLLLTVDPKNPLSELLKARWLEYHHLTGDRFWFVALQPPAEWTESFKDYWKQKLGESFEEIWQYWQSGRGHGQGAAYKYLDLFRDPKIKASQLPCLVIFTDPGKRQAVVRSLPNWDTESLHELLVGIFEAILECCEREKKEERLECLKRSLTSLSARSLAYLSHVRRKAERFLKEHPAQIAVTAASFILALHNASVLPIALGPAAAAVSQIIKDALSRR